jgi:hypothetical protein
MAKTYYYKGAKILAPLTIVSNEPHFDMTTVSLKTQRASQGHQRWEMSFSVLSTASEEVDMFLGVFENIGDVQTMVMPQLPSVAGESTLTGTPLIATGAPAGASIIDIDGSITLGNVPKGTFIKFSNHDKVYITTADFTLSGGADSLLNIYPALTTSVPTSATLVTGDSVDFTFYQSIDNQAGITFTDGILSNPGTITLLEAL